MDLGASSGLRGRRILIVESEVVLGPKLQDALEREGAETVIVGDPYSEEGAKRIATFTVSAAAINSVHRGLARALDEPVLIYGPNTAVPSEVDAIVRELKTMLSGRC